MKKLAILGSIALFAANFASAAVTVDTQPVSLVTSPLIAAASSSPIGVFKFALNADSGETLSSVTVSVAAQDLSTVAGSDINTIAVYKDNNSNGTLESGTDLLAGSESTVNVGSDTTVTTSSNNFLPGTFFVAISTASSWSGISPVDSIKVSLADDGIVTSANSPTVDAVTSDTISAQADNSGPELQTAVASKVSGDKEVTLTFDEATNKPTINSSNINSVLTLNNSHSWLDGSGAIGSATWSSDGKTLTVVLSDTTSSPTVAVGDKVTVDGSTIKDASDNNATGDAVISGNFNSTSGEGEGDEGDNEDGEGMPCSNTLINGRLYKTADSATVYLAANCILKPFRGEAVFHARGHKFQNIVVLSSLTGFTVSDKPALPAAGTLVKGSDKTVWFIEIGGKRRGFASANVFLALGFKFSQVNIISDSDLQQLLLDSNPINSDTTHPDGALIKCNNSSTVFQVNGTQEAPFTSEDSFELRGHSFDQVASVDCGKFKYVVGVQIK